jgi:large subunit ribosomal protein L29
MSKKSTELRSQTIEELRSMEEDLAKEIFNLRNDANISREVKKTSAMREKRRARARVLTILREKHNESR